MKLCSLSCWRWCSVLCEVQDFTVPVHCPTCMQARQTAWAVVLPVLGSLTETMTVLTLDVKAVCIKWKCGVCCVVWRDFFFIFLFTRNTPKLPSAFAMIVLHFHNNFPRKFYKLFAAECWIGLLKWLIAFFCSRLQSDSWSDYLVRYLVGCLVVFHTGSLRCSWALVQYFSRCSVPLITKGTFKNILSIV